MRRLRDAPAQVLRRLISDPDRPGLPEQQVGAHALRAADADGQPLPPPEVKPVDVNGIVPVVDGRKNSASRPQGPRGLPTCVVVRLPGVPPRYRPRGGLDQGSVDVQPSPTAQTIAAGRTGTATGRSG